MIYIYVTRLFDNLDSHGFDANRLLLRSDKRYLSGKISTEIHSFIRAHANTALCSNIPFNNIFASDTEDKGLAYDISIGPFKSVKDAEQWVTYLKRYGYREAQIYEYDKDPDSRDDLVVVFH